MSKRRYCTSYDRQCIVFVLHVLVKNNSVRHMTL